MKRVKALMSLQLLTGYVKLGFAGLAMFSALVIALTGDRLNIDMPVKRRKGSVGLIRYECT